MSATWSWSPVVAGVIGVVGVLAGVWLNQRAARQQRFEERQAARSVEQRDAIAELIDAAEQWTPRAKEAAHSLLGGRTDPDELIKVFKGPDAAAAAAALQRLRSALVRCRLVVTDEQTRPVLLRVDGAVRDGFDRLYDEAVAKSLNEKQVKQSEWFAVMQRVDDYYQGVDGLVQQLQDVALTRLT